MELTSEGGHSPYVAVGGVSQNSCGACADLEYSGISTLGQETTDLYQEQAYQHSLLNLVSWLTQSDQSDFSIGGVYFSYTPPRRCIFFAWGLDLLSIMGPWYKSVTSLGKHASFTRLRRLFNMNL